MTDIVDRLTYRAENLWADVRPHAAILDLEAAAEIERLRDILRGIDNWCKAYPRTVFIEPTKEEWGNAAKALKDTEGCPSLDAISGSNMRHVVEGLKTMVGDALCEK